MNPLTQKIVSSLGEIIGIVVAAMVTLLFRKFQAWLQQRASAEAISELSKIARIAVQAAQQTVVSSLKDPNHPGEWNAQAALRVRNDVLGQIRTMGGTLIESLRRNGMPELAISTLIDQLVESHVQSEKNRASGLSSMLQSALQQLASSPSRTVPSPVDAPTEGSAESPSGESK